MAALLQGCLCITLALALQISTAADTDSDKSAGRQLSYAHIAGYEPGSDVIQHSLIDLDQKEMESHLGAAIPAWAKAKNIYNLGGNSGGYAQMTVAALSTAVAKGAVVTQGNGVTGKAKSSASAGATTLKVSYTSMCKDGGSSQKALSGCFVAGRSLSVAGANMAAPSAVVNKYRSLAGFSTAAESKMKGQEYYDVYHSYYMNGDYAHRYVTAALDGTGEFQGQSDDARIQGAKKGSAYMNVWMYVIREMEDAVADCQAGCLDCNDDPVHAWDEGVAFYAGSLEGTDGSGSGKLLHALADKRCSNYGTCDANGLSKVNKEIFTQFTLGKNALLGGKCTDTHTPKRRIVELMSIPLIQGALRYAYKVNKLSGGNKERAEGAVFAAAILPRVNACDKSAGILIDNNMVINTDTPMKDGVAKVKQAFESTYKCLGISCGDIGGLILTGSDYYEGMEPCNDADLPSAGDTSQALRSEVPFWGAFVMMGLHVVFMIMSV